MIQVSFNRVKLNIPRIFFIEKIVSRSVPWKMLKMFVRDNQLKAIQWILTVLMAHVSKQIVNNCQAVNCFIKSHLHTHVLAKIYEVNTSTLNWLLFIYWQWYLFIFLLCKFWTQNIHTKYTQWLTAQYLLELQQLPGCFTNESHKHLGRVLKGLFPTLMQRGRFFFVLNHRFCLNSASDWSVIFTLSRLKKKNLLRFLRWIWRACQNNSV